MHCTRNGTNEYAEARAGLSQLLLYESLGPAEPEAPGSEIEHERVHNSRLFSAGKPEMLWLERSGASTTAFYRRQRHCAPTYKPRQILDNIIVHTESLWCLKISAVAHKRSLVRIIGITHHPDFDTPTPSIRIFLEAVGQHTTG
jgi:hypothetical protein